MAAGIPLRRSSNTGRPSPSGHRAWSPHPLKTSHYGSVGELRAELGTASGTAWRTRSLSCEPLRNTALPGCTSSASAWPLDIARESHPPQRCPDELSAYCSLPVALRRMDEDQRITWLLRNSRPAGPLLPARPPAGGPPPRRPSRFFAGWEGLQRNFGAANLPQLRDLDVPSGSRICWK